MAAEHVAVLTALKRLSKLETMESFESKRSTWALGMTRLRQVPSPADWIP